MTAITRTPAIMALVLSLAVTTACTQVTNPATGQSEFTAMSPEQEKAVGDEQHPKILQQFGGAYDDPKLQAYVEEIGGRLQAVSELPDLDFTFTLLNSDVVNAFALPGGYVYISRGLMALAENEAEVAGVMAHEIGHVTARHSAQRYSRGVLAQGGLTVGTVLAGVLGGGNVAQAVQELGGTGAKAYLAGYSREQEFQSDELGVRYLTRAGYDPRAMATFLEKLGEQSELARKLAGQEDGPDPSTSMFATHPRTPERVAKAAENAAGASATAGRVGRETYLQRIDGMTYGEDSSQGFVRDRTFIHPELRVVFEAPPGYRLQNTPSAVIGADEAGNGLKFDSATMRSADMRDYLTREWAKELKIQNLNQISSFDLNGFPAISAATSGKDQNGNRLDVGLAAIQVDAGKVYRFMFFSPGGASPAEAQAARSTVESFRFLSTAAAAQYKPKRIKVVSANAGDTSATFASRMAVDALPDQHFEVLNGLEPSEGLESGQLVKIISE